jgi:MYXO-CTERM domain-containing protein
VLEEPPTCAELDAEDTRIPGQPEANGPHDVTGSAVEGFDDDQLNTGCDTSGGSPLPPLSFGLLALIGLARRLR